MRVILAAIVLVAAYVTPVSAGNNPLGFGQLILQEKQNPIEQQSDYPWLPGGTDCSANANCIINPTGCAWDVDDHGQYIVIDRVLRPGESGGVDWCVIYDAKGYVRTICGLGGDPNNCMTASWSSFSHRVGLTVKSNSPDLAVTLSFGAKVFTLTPFWNADRQWQYDICAKALYDVGDPALTIIPGSVVSGPNGTGVQFPVSIRVANPSAKRATVTLDAQNIGVGQQGAGCHTTSVAYADYQHDYPWWWIVP